MYGGIDCVMEKVIRVLDRVKSYASRKYAANGCVIRGSNCIILKSVRVTTILTLEDNVWILKNCIISGNDPVSIGRGTNLLPGNWVSGPTRIGRYCAIAPNSCFLGGNHRMNWAGMQVRFYNEMFGVPLGGEKKGGVEVGSDVWVGTGVIITPGVRVGDGAVIGAGSVVTKNVPPYSITAGNPAKHVSYRFSSEIVEKLLSLKWWDWPIDRIKRNRKFFTTDLNSVTDFNSIVVD
jgi:virginiamycin A acetyltransferase